MWLKLNLTLFYYTEHVIILREFFIKAFKYAARDGIKRLILYIVFKLVYRNLIKYLNKNIAQPSFAELAVTQKKLLKIANRLDDNIIIIKNN